MTESLPRPAASPTLWVRHSPAETGLGVLLAALVAAAAWASSGAVRMVWLAVVASALVILVLHAASWLVHVARWSRDAWFLLERIRPELIGHQDIAPILRVALAPAPAILGCASVELRLPPRRTIDGVIARATDDGGLVVRPMVGEPTRVHPWEPDSLVLPLPGSGPPSGQLVLRGLSPRIPRRRRGHVAAAFTHILSTAIGTQRWREAQRRETDEANWLARHDELTSLGTRVVLAEQGDHRLAASRERGSTAALLLVDLDDFKGVNDTLGHGAGDRVLAEVGRRLRSAVRPDDLAVRLGGDELVVLACDLLAPEDAETLAQRLVDRIRAPLRLADATIEVSASVGVAIRTDGPRTTEDLLVVADLALYEAKAAGRGQWRTRHAVATGPTQAPGLPRDLPDGVQTHDRQIHYEAQASATTGAVTGFVAAGPGPEGGAEGLLLDQAMRDLHRLRQPVPDATLSVYVSPRSLLTGRLVGALTDALDRHDVPAGAMVLEMTEPAVDPPPAVLACLTDLARLGCRLSIRGFGSGPSSLALLSRHRAIAEIKISPALSAGATSDPVAARLVRASVTTARELGIQVVAEGVDSVGTADLLARLGCDRLQGPLLHEPAPLPDVLAWLRSRGGTGGLPCAGANRGPGLQWGDRDADSRDDPTLRRGATMA